MCDTDITFYHTGHKLQPQCFYSLALDFEKLQLAKPRHGQLKECRRLSV